MNPLLKEFLKHYSIKLIEGKCFCYDIECFNECKIRKFCDDEVIERLKITREDIKEVKIFKLEHPEYFV